MLLSCQVGQARAHLFNCHREAVRERGDPGDLTTPESVVHGDAQVFGVHS